MKKHYVVLANQDASAFSNLADARQRAVDLAADPGYTAGPWGIYELKEAYTRKPTEFVSVEIED